MTLLEQRDLVRLRQCLIKDYNAVLNSLTKIQDQLFKILDDKELSDEGKCKMLAQLQDGFGYLLNKFTNAALDPANILPPQPPLPLPAPAEHVGDGRPAAVVQTDTEDFFSP